MPVASLTASPSVAARVVECSLTPRCSGLATLAAELVSLGRASRSRASESFHQQGATSAACRLGAGAHHVPNRPPLLVQAKAGTVASTCRSSPPPHRCPQESTNRRLRSLSLNKALQVRCAGLAPAHTTFPIGFPSCFKPRREPLRPRAGVHRHRADVLKKPRQFQTGRRELSTFTPSKPRAAVRHSNPTLKLPRPSWRVTGSGITALAHRHGLTRRCSGLAALAAELVSLGRASRYQSFGGSPPRAASSAAFRFGNRAHHGPNRLPRRSQAKALPVPPTRRTSLPPRRPPRGERIEECC